MHEEDDDEMKKAIALLKEQLVLIDKAVKAFRELKKALVENPTGKGVTEASTLVEPAVLALQRFGIKQEKVLREAGETRVITWIAHAKPTEERLTAVRLFQKANEAQKSLRYEVVSTAELLKRSKEFIDFHVNVLTHVVANDTYAKTGEDETVPPERGIKMFEADV